MQTAAGCCSQGSHACVRAVVVEREHSVMAGVAIGAASCRLGQTFSCAAWQQERPATRLDAASAANRCSTDHFSTSSDRGYTAAARASRFSRQGRLPATGELLRLIAPAKAALSGSSVPSAVNRLHTGCQARRIEQRRGRCVASPAARRATATAHARHPAWPSTNSCCTHLPH